MRRNKARLPEPEPQALVLDLGRTDCRRGESLVLAATGGGRVQELRTKDVEARLISICKMIKSRTDSNEVVLSFPEGRWAGLIGTVQIDGRRIRCRLRTQSAVQREQLRRGADRLGARLSAMGLLLDAYEVF